MAGRPPSKQAPLFGQRMAAFRKSKGLTQRELAERLDTTLKMVDYYERRAVNPSLDLLQRVAEALGVSVAELLGAERNGSSRRARPGPSSKLQRRVEQIKQLSRKDQEFVIRFLDIVLEKAGRA